MTWSRWRRRLYWAWRFKQWPWAVSSKVVTYVKPPALITEEEKSKVVQHMHRLVAEGKIRV